MSKILIVEDEADIRELIHFNLYKEKFEIAEAKDGQEALDLNDSFKPNLILLDIMIPKISGLDVCKKIKANPKFKDTKIIFLSAKGEEEDIVNGLNNGADDYITKPFSPKILIARIKSNLRNLETHSKETLVNAHGINLDLNSLKCLIEDKEIILSATEFQILKVFISNPGRVFSRINMVELIKGSNYSVTDRSIDTQVVSLRKKLQDKGKLIETVWGVGYRLKEI